MNFLKRAFHNLIYRKVYNLGLLVMMAILATLILVGFAVRTASANSCVAIRRELGGAVTLRGANNKVPMELAQKVEKLEHVQSINFELDAQARSVSFKAVGDPLSLVTENAKTAKLANLDAAGVTQSAQLSGFTNGNYELTAGRHLTADDTGTSNAMIEQTLAQQDHLKVGDRITLASTTNGRKQTFAVVGIYKDTNPAGGAPDPSLESGNQIFVPYTAAQELNGATTLDKAVFYMDDPVNIDSFRAEASKLLSGGYELDAQDADYQRMAGSLSDLSFIANCIVYIVLAVGAALLSLIVVLSLKGRNYEIGVLLAVGEKKAKIIAQMAVEILVPVLIAFTLSAAVGNLAAGRIGQAMLQSEKQAQQDISGTDSSQTVTDNRTGKTYSTDQNIAVRVSGEDIGLVYAAGVLIALVSSAAPVATVLRYSPKKILALID